MRGNVIDLAIGIIIGAGFNTIVQSLVKNVILPPIGFVLGKVDFSNLYINISGQSFASLSDAEKAGAAVIKYGLFLNDLISFLITALVVFLVVQQINRFRKRFEAPPAVPSTGLCPFCLSNIPLKATRCPLCTSILNEPVKLA